MLLISPSDWPTLQVMLTALRGNLPDITRLITALSYVSGVLFMLKAVYVLKEYGELRTMMSSQVSIVKPAVMFTVASMLLYFPSSYHIALETVFGVSNASAYGYSSTDYESWHGIITVVVQIIEILGMISFLRGIFMLTALAHSQSPQGAVGKSFTHLIGGILAMNIVGFSHVIQSTLGITVS